MRLTVDVVKVDQVDKLMIERGQAALEPKLDGGLKLRDVGFNLIGRGRGRVKPEKTGIKYNLNTFPNMLLLLFFIFLSLTALGIK